MSLPVILTYFGGLAYVGLIVFLVACLFARRCRGIDEHAMIPGDERLANVREETAP